MIMIITTRDIDTVYGRMRVTVEEDEDAGSPDSESLTCADMTAWLNDAWQYVIVTVNALHYCAQCKAEHLGMEFESLSGVHFGHGDGWRVGIDDLIIIHPVPDLIDELGKSMKVGA